MSMIMDADKTKPTVLVVDDEAGPRDALKVILRPFFNIRSADNAQAALEILNEQPVDLITLDQKLPDRQGIDLLQDIKHDHADIEVIIITGYGSLKSAMEGIRHGAAGYLLKPFNVCTPLRPCGAVNRTAPGRGKRSGTDTPRSVTLRTRRAPPGKTPAIGFPCCPIFWKPRTGSY
jgi:DNA-binding NtrC family response regulator